MFSKLLLRWHLHHNHRKMPWKGIKDPYKIWLSEIILQQTRVEQGEKYYHALLEKYPTIADLANAEEAALYRLWQGLGYYNRCKNMLHTAQIITQQHQGKFPDTYDAIRQLKGIGPYTAAAIASFAFDLPYAVIDGNVVRILSRYFGLKIDFNQGQGKKEFEALAASLLDQKNNALFNQAMMDFGAIQCTPTSPHCFTCPLSESCEALRSDRIGQLPIKLKTLKVKTRHLTYIYIRCKNETAIRRRSAGDIWQGLWEPLLIENEDIPDLGGKLTLLKQKVKHVLTHRIIYADFYLLEIQIKPQLPEGYIWIDESKIDNYALPRLFEILLEQIKSLDVTTLF